MSVAAEGPITVIVSRVVKAGREADFEEWVRRVTHDAAMAEGWLGYNLIRPSDHEHAEYVIVFKFDTYDNLKGWEASPVRDAWLEKEKALDMTVGGPQYRQESGLEYWFRTADDGPPLRPAKYKMAVLTFLALYPTVVGVGFVLGPLMVGWQPLLAMLVTLPVTVLLMTWAVMPIMTEAFGFWIFGAAR